MAKRDRTDTLRWLREQTERRHEQRGRRMRTLLFLCVGSLVMLVLSLPSLLTATPFAHSLIDSIAKPYGWTVQVKKIRIGWITPLHLSGINAVGPSGKTIINAESLDARINIIDLIRGIDDLGTIHLAAFHLESEVHEGASYLEEDIAPFLEPSEESTDFTASVEIRDGAIKVSQSNTDRNWRADQVQASVELSSDATAIDIAGVLTDSLGISGSTSVHAVLPNGTEPIDVQVKSEGLPLSLLDLIVLRFPEASQGLPEVWSGNASGSVAANVHYDGNFDIQANSFEVKNLVVRDSTLTNDQEWKVGRLAVTGGTRLEGDSLRFQNLTFHSDSADGTLDGLVNLTAVNAGHYLDAMLGSFETKVDLAALSQKFPGLLPVRSGVTINDGQVTAKVEGQYGEDQSFRSSWNLDATPITATLGTGQRLVLQPITADVILKPTGALVTAEKLAISSSFGRAQALGDLRSGSLQFDLNCEELSATLSTILDLPATRLEGTASGRIAWSATENQLWKLSGKASARDLIIELAGINSIRRPSLQVELAGEGRWTGSRLGSLNQASLKIIEPNQSWLVKLEDAIQNPTADSLFALHILGHGRLESLLSLVPISLPYNIEDVIGDVQADVHCKLSQSRGQIEKADVVLTNPSIIFSGQQYKQDSVKASFVGLYTFPENVLRAEILTCSGNAASFSAQGDMGPNVTNLNIAFLTDLDRLNRIAVTPLPAPPQSDVMLSGQVEGNVDLRGQGTGTMHFVINTNAKDLRVVQPSVNAAQVIWHEPTATMNADIMWLVESGTLTVARLASTSAWLDSFLSGEIEFHDRGYNINLEGPAEVDVATISDRIAQLLGEPIKLAGKHKTPLKIKANSDVDLGLTYIVKGSIGWDSAQVAGVTAGASEIPVELNERTINIQPSRIPIQKGVVNIGGQVHYQEQPLWFEQHPGLFAENITLTPDMCRSWLKYMLPIAADTTDVVGTFALELDECKVVPSDPIRSSVNGTLNVEDVSIGPGPLTRSLMGTISQVQAATKGIQGQPANEVGGTRQWVLLDPQSVDFSLVNGLVTHQRLQMRIDKAKLISSGSVSLDGNLNLRFQVPLEASWIGADLSTLVGRQIVLPVGGTLSRPILDAQSVAQMLAQMGTQALQSNAESYLQKQFDRQFQKLFKN